MLKQITKVDMKNNAPQANDTLHAAFRGYPLVEAKEREEDFYE